jgi:hypothetical protein
MLTDSLVNNPLAMRNSVSEFWSSKERYVTLPGVAGSQEKRF